jgi:hypothetical protein
MHSRLLTYKVGQIATAGIVVVLLAGCAQTKSMMSSMRSSPTEVESVSLGAPDADHYIQEIYSVAAGDPATQAEIYADAASGSKLTPGPQTELRFALVLATPGHVGYDPVGAQRMLRALLSQPSLLTQTEIALATISLTAVEEQIIAESEANRARVSSTRAAESEEAATQRRLANLEAENRRLRQDLAEAEEKLEAITTIERSIREQD